MKKHPTQSGFVILFTILISAIILMIGAGIFSIATRETVLSSTARESQLAFYAADAGVECALYAQGLGQISGNGSFKCGQTTDVGVSGDGSVSNPFIFDILIVNAVNGQKSCAHVNIFGPSIDDQMRVISQGYNICNTDSLGKPVAVTTNPILVERDLDTLYGVSADTTGGVPPSSTQKNPGGLTPLTGLQQLANPGAPASNSKIPTGQASGVNVNPGALAQPASQPPASSTKKTP